MNLCSIFTFYSFATFHRSFRVSWISHKFPKLFAATIGFIWSWCPFSFLPEASKPPVSILLIRRRQQVLHSWSVHWPSESKYHFGLWAGKIQFYFQGKIDVLILCRTVNNLIIFDSVPSVRLEITRMCLNLHKTNDKASSYNLVRTIP